MIQVLPKNLSFAEYLAYDDRTDTRYELVYAARYISTPKLPTISVYQLSEGEYQVLQFRGAERIISATFPDLILTAEQVFVGR
jgi:Uma2 family endonuclease